MFTLLPEAAVTWNPVDVVSTQFVEVTSAAVEFNKRYGSVDDDNPLLESQTYQSPVESVLFMRTNLAPEVNPQLIVCSVPVPVKAVHLLTPAQVANK